MKPTLYHYWRSSASWRARWALELKKIPYESIHVNLLNGEEKKPDYLQKNPAGYLPCLIVDGKNIAESMAIIEWLEENHPENSFFCGDTFLRAKIRQLAETINSGIQPLQNLVVLKKLSDDKKIQTEWSQYWIRRGLKVYEDILKEVRRKSYHFSLSDRPSIADICLIPQCYSALRNEVALEEFPICLSIYEYALKTPECKAAHPDRFQPSES